ncbi:ankyrin repeat-containing domain protein [Cadophora sp. MPI-SDFR-AT-0126]|nr:ankyrin repeat-containing domain protein [Leotiomycetes sp. MPI-SDFR-AT-0126]
MEPVKRPHFRRQVPIQVVGEGQRQYRHIYPSISPISDHESISTRSTSKRYATSSSTSSTRNRTDPALSLSQAITTSSPSTLHNLLRQSSISPLQTTHLLHQAIAHGSKECIRILLDHGADINGLSPQGRTPLQAAIRDENSRESIAKLLISRGADLSLGAPLHWAARRDWASVVEMLCVYGAEVDRPSHTASTPSMRGRHGDGSGGGEGITALHLAAYYDALASARVLIAHGAAVELHTSSGELALAEAIANRSVSMVDLLLSSGISIHAAVDASGGTPLMAACCLDDVSLVRCLMRHGAGSTVECRDGEGETAAGVAAAWAGREVLECLVEMGADVNCRNERGETPLEIAVRKGRPMEVVEVLLRAGARRDGGVEGALEEAVRHGGGKFDFDLVDLLNRYGSPVGGERGRKGMQSERSFDEMSQRSDETVGRRDGDFDRRVTRYVIKRSPDYTHSNTMGRAPSPSNYFDDGTSTVVDSSARSESEWSSSHLSRDRRIMKWSADQYETPLGSKTGSLFGENWCEEFDSRFDNAFETERSEYSSGRRSRGRGRGRGRVTNIVSFTVYV